MLQSTVSSQGQIFLPRALRKHYQIESGDKIVFVLRDDAILLRKVPKNLAKATMGILKKEIDRGGGVEKAHANWEEEWEKTI